MAKSNGAFEQIGLKICSKDYRFFFTGFATGFFAALGAGFAAGFLAGAAAGFFAVFAAGFPTCLLVCFAGW